MHAAGQEGGRVSLTVTIPGMRLRSPNAMRGTTRGARMAAAREAKRLRSTADIFTTVTAKRAHGGGTGHSWRGSWPQTVTLTRIAPRAFDDDNLAASFKAVRDGVADALGVKDNDSRVRWVYAQRRGLPREYSVEIRIEPEAADATQHA
jgi:hypothetical protein